MTAAVPSEQVPIDTRVPDAALIASELRYRRLFESAKDGILILDAETGKVVDVNPFLIERMGISREQFLDKKIWELGFFNDVIANQESFKELQENEYIHYEDKPLRAADGHQIDVEFVSNVYLVNGQKVIQCNIRDITERKRIEEALRREEALFATLANTIPDHIYFKDRQSRFIRINAAMARRFGLPDAAAAIGRTDFSLFGEEHDRQAYADEQRIMETGKPMIGVDERETWPDGSVNWFSTTKMPLRDAQGCITGLVGVSRDTTRLKQTERLLLLRSAALESAANAIAITDNKGVIEWVNSAFCTLAGYSAAESIGQNLGRLVKSGKHNDAFYKRLWATLLSEGVWRGDVINMRKDGSLYTEFQTITSVKDERGKVAHYVAIKEDTTAERAAEDRIRYLNRIYSMLSAINQTIVRDQDPNEVFADACKIAVEKGGFRLAWIATMDKQSKAMMIAAHAGTGENFLEHISKMLSSDASLAGPLKKALHTGARMVCNDIGADHSGEHWQMEALQLGFRAAVSLPILASGNVVGSLNLCASEAGLFTDQEMRLLTEIAADLGRSVEIHEREKVRREAETALKLSDFSVQHASVATIWIASDARILRVNNAVTKLLGYSEAELLSLAITDLEPDFNAERWPAHWQELREKRRMSFETWQRHKSGRLIPVQIDLNWFEFEGREYNFGFVHDITATRELEQQFRQAQKMEAVGQLASGVAHDFNNILASVLLYLGLLQEDPSMDPIIGVSLKELEMDVRRGTSLVQQLLTFSRQKAMEPKVLDLRDLLQGLAKMLHRLLGEHIDIVVDGPDGLPLVKADPGMIEQVVINLSVNARDAMPKGGLLSLRLDAVEIGAKAASANPEAREGRFLRLRVADTGCGMTEATLHRLFEPFFTTKGLGKGTGLGLATVYGVVKQHEGWIDVQSAVGAGTTFSVFLPACETTVVDAGENEDRVMANGRNETVLVVEDENSLRAAMVRTLRRHGYRAFEAVNGADALLCWGKHRGEIDLLLTDMVLPGRMNGREITAKLQADKPGLKVVICTGYSQASDLEGLDPAQVFVLRKPFTQTVLLKSLRQRLDAV